MGIDCAVAFSRVDGLLRQLAQDLHVADLRAVLSEVFGFMRYEGERTIDYFSPAGHALSLQYLAARRDRDPFGVVAELRRGPDLTDEDVNRLSDLYELVRRPEAVHFNSMFLFSHRPLTGYWRYGDQFQILPPPPGAPLPREQLADWPFILELRYSSPDQGGLILKRRMQATDRLRVLLPVLLIGPTYHPHWYRGIKHWVLPDRPDDKPFPLGPSEWAQEGYHVPDWTPGGPDLSSLDGLNLRRSLTTTMPTTGPRAYARETYWRYRLNSRNCSTSTLL